MYICIYVYIYKEPEPRKALSKPTIQEAKTSEPCGRTTANREYRKPHTPVWKLLGSLFQDKPLHGSHDNGKAICCGRRKIKTPDIAKTPMSSRPNSIYRIQSIAQAGRSFMSACLVPFFFQNSYCDFIIRLHTFRLLLLGRPPRRPPRPRRESPPMSVCREPLPRRPRLPPARGCAVHGFWRGS